MVFADAGEDSAVVNDMSFRSVFMRRSSGFETKRIKVSY